MRNYPDDREKTVDSWVSGPFSLGIKAVPGSIVEREIVKCWFCGCSGTEFISDGIFFINASHDFSVCDFPDGEQTGLTQKNIVILVVLCDFRGNDRFFSASVADAGRLFGGFNLCRLGLRLRRRTRQRLLFGNRGSFYCFIAR